MDLALHNQQRLIRHQNQQTNKQINRDSLGATKIYTLIFFLNLPI